MCLRYNLFNRRGIFAPGARSWCGGFQDLSFAFQDWKYAHKRHKWKEKVQKNAQFLWTNESFSLWNCLSRNSTLFSTRRMERLAWLVLNQPRHRGFWRHLRYIPYTLWSKKSSFLKEMNFCIYKGFMDVFYILTSEWKKNHKMYISNWFFTMCSTHLTCVNATI